jgi:hypothetical protein
MAYKTAPAPVRVAPEISFGTDEELIFRNAIRVLNNAGLLDEETRAEFSVILNGELSPKEALATREALNRAEQMEQTEEQGGAQAAISE